MTIASTITSTTAVANGSTTQFPFQNKIFAATDLVVMLKDPSGNLYPFANFANISLGLSYQVQNVDVDTGAYIVFNSPPTNGWTVGIRSATPELQSTSVKNQGQFLPELHEEAFDRATRLIQDLLRISYTYGIHASDNEITPWPALPSASARKGLALMFDASTGLPTVGIPTIQTLTQGLIGLLLYPATQAEINSGVVIVSQSYPPGYIRRYGAAGDGTTNDSVAVQAAFSSGVAKIFGTQGDIYKVTQTIAWNSGQCDVDWQNSKVSFTGLSANNFAFTFSDTVATVRRKVMRNGQLVGPAASSSVDCFSFTSSVANGVTNISFDGMEISEFRRQLVYGNNCSMINFANSVFRNDGVTNTSNCIYTAGTLTNSGEGWCFDRCQFGSFLNSLANNAAISGEFNFNQCQFDYATCTFNLQAPVRVRMLGGHIESNLHTSNWFIIGTNCNGAVISLRDMDLWLTATSITKEIFYSGTGNVFGGIYLDNVFCAIGGNFTVDFWADQSVQGNIYARNFKQYDGEARIPIGKNPGVQIEAFPCSAAGFGAGLQTGGSDGSTVAISSAQQFDGNTTSITTTTTGQLINRFKDYPVFPGADIVAQVYVKATGFTADGTNFSIIVDSLDTYGQVIGSSTVLSASVDIGTFTKVPLTWYPMAAGAAKYRVNVFAPASAGNNTRSVFLGQQVINAS